ncbi:hypothetical protein ABPG75_002971 [Micractinium tetrahymenae]
MGNLQAKGAGALAAAPVQAAEQPDWDLLPPELLGRILALAGKAAGPAVTLVFKSWRAAWFEEAALHQEFSLRAPYIPPAPGQPHGDWPSPAQRAAAAAALEGRKFVLQRVGHLVTVLHISGSPEVSGSLADCLDLLPAEPLAELRLGGGHLSAEWLQRLKRFPRLRTLALASSTGVQWTPNACAALCALHQQLQALEVGGLGGLTESAMDAVLSLTRLSSLRIHLRAGPPSYLDLTRLSALRHLTLCASSPPAAPLPRPASFAKLQSCRLGRLGESCGWTFQVDGEPALALRGCLWDCSTGALDVSGFSAGSLPHLERLLAALLPPGVALASLALHNCSLDLAAEAHAQQPAAPLASLTALHLRCCTTTSPADMDSSLQALLAACGGRRLRHLVARTCSLTCLPPADCLPGNKGLVELDLSSNCLRCLPPALAAASRLTRLCLDHNSIQLTPEDCQPWGPLIRLCCLAHLSLAANRLRDLPPGAYLPALTYLDLDSNPALQRLPLPALLAATSLRCLSLGGPLGGPQPAIGIADVRSLLSRLASLEDLHIARLPAMTGLATVCLCPRLRLWDAILARKHLQGARLSALVLGDAHAGKSTLLATLRRELDLKIVDWSSPFIGMSCERVEGGDLTFSAMDSGLVAQQGKLYQVYTPVMQECSGRVVFVVEGRDRGPGQLAEEAMRDGTVLVLLNLGDAKRVPGPWLSIERVEAALGLHSMGLRHWDVQDCSAATGEGVWQALAWMARVAAANGDDGRHASS